MSGNIHVNYDNVYATIDNMQSRLTNAIDIRESQIDNMVIAMQAMDGASNDVGIELFHFLQLSSRSFDTTTTHFLTAVRNSTQHLQTEERTLASNFDSFLNDIPLQ